PSLPWLRRPAFDNKGNEKMRRKRSFAVNKWPRRSEFITVIGQRHYALMVIRHCHLRWTNCWKEYRFPADRRTDRFCAQAQRAILYQLQGSGVLFIHVRNR